MEHPDSFSEWHRCRRWRRRGLSCPFRALEDMADNEEDADAKPFGQPAFRKELAREGAGFKGAFDMEFIGPLLALFTLMRAVQIMGGLPVGNVVKMGMAEEATTRVLQPRVPAREGPTPARKHPGVPVGTRGSPAPKGAGGGGGFFSNQAAELKNVISGAGFTRK